jgi:hypothetical protein
MRSVRRLVANGPTHHRGKHFRLFDDLIRQRAQSIWHTQSECLGSLHVDHQLKLDRRLDRKFARLLASEDPICIGRRTPVLVDENRLRDQAAEFGE